MIRVIRTRDINYAPNRYSRGKIKTSLIHERRINNC